MRVSVDLDVTVKCAKCREELEVYNLESNLDDVEVEVMPCECEKEEE